MNKNIWIPIVVAVVFAAGGFFAGMKYQQSKAPAAFSLQSFQNMTPQQRQQFAQQFRGGRGGNFGGLVNGQIIAKTDSNMTIKDQSGNTHIVILAPSTQTRKAVDASSTDLTAGESVTVTGQANSDGSITAQTVQIRQNTGSGQQGNNPQQ